MKNEQTGVTKPPPLTTPVSHEEPVLDESLPAPNWSPTVEEGYWVWRDESWKWLTDEEYLQLKQQELWTRREQEL